MRMTANKIADSRFIRAISGQNQATILQTTIHFRKHLVQRILIQAVSDMQLFAREWRE